jgi:calcineurin-like phosphoesterase family protein
MSRAPLPPVTVALDPGVAAWSLRRLLRRVSAELGTPQLDPVLAVTRPFRLTEGTGLAAVRAAVETAIPDALWLSSDLDGFAASHGGTVGLGLRPSPLLESTAAAIESALSAIAVPTNLPDERFLVPAARGLDRRRLRSALRTLGLAPPSWYRRLLASFGAAGQITPLPPPLRPLEAIRLLVLVGGSPAAGYDLAARRWFSRPELGDRAVLGSSLRTYRRARGLELAAPAPHPAGERWLLADLHLGHPGITLYTARPFLASDVGEMDRVLIGNWRRTVAPVDPAFLLGDLCAGPDPCAYRAAVGALSGRLTLVRGNHDPDLPGLARSVAFEAGGHRFLGVHDPADASRDFDGWVIHGHLHDSDLRRFPFFDPEARRVNVSVETAGYCPVPLSLVCALISGETGPILVRKAFPATLDTPALKGPNTSLIKA